MQEFVIDDKTVNTPIGEVLRLAKRGELVLLDSAGRTLARIDSVAPRPLPPLTDEELEEIRRRSRSDRSDFMSTDELMRRLRARTA